MSRRTRWPLLLLTVLLAGCMVKAPTTVKTEFYPLKIADGWASEVQFKNLTDQVQTITVRNPVYTMIVQGSDGTEVYRQEFPLSKEQQLESILPKAHKAYVLTWPAKNQAGERVAPGTYTIKFDFNVLSGDQKIPVPNQTVRIE